MASKFTHILVLFLAVVDIYAQSTLTILANNSDLSKPNTRLEMVLNLNNRVDSLLYIVLPAKLKAVPLSVQKGNDTLWLKNSIKRPDKKDAISWTVSDGNTIIFRFLKGAVVPGDILKVVCMVKYRGKQSQEDKILLKSGPTSAIIAETLLTTISR